MATYNTQKTDTSALSSEMQTYYNRQLLENMKPKLVHYEYGQKRPHNHRNGKTVNFRKWTPFGAITSPLTEGVVPDGQNLAQTDVSATVAQYGGYVAVSDMLDLTAIDPVVSDAVDLMADQGALSVDTIIRDEIHKGTNKIIGNSKTARYYLVAGDKLTTTDVRKAVRTLKKSKALPFTRGGRSYYVAIVGPDAVYDLQSDQLWQDVSKYQEKEAIFSGEIGRIFGVIFVETTEAKIMSATDLSAGARNLSCASYVTATKVLTVKEALTAGDATALVGRKILITNTDSGAVAEQDTIAAAAAGAAGSATITLTTGLAATQTKYADQSVYPGEAGAAGISVASTLFLGQNAYGVVDIENGSRPRAIVKNADNSGTEDPLEQINTVGWKVDAFAAVILQQLFMVRLEHGYSA